MPTYKKFFMVFTEQVRKTHIKRDPYVQLDVAEIYKACTENFHEALSHIYAFCRCDSTSS